MRKRIHPNVSHLAFVDKVYAIFMRLSFLLLLLLLDSFFLRGSFNIANLGVFFLSFLFILWFNLQTKDLCRSIERMHAVNTARHGSYGGFGKSKKTKRPANYFRIKRLSARLFLQEKKNTLHGHRACVQEQ